MRHEVKALHDKLQLEFCFENGTRVSQTLSLAEAQQLQTQLTDGIVNVIKYRFDTVRGDGTIDEKAHVQSLVFDKRDRSIQVLTAPRSMLNFQV